MTDCPTSPCSRRAARDVQGGSEGVAAVPAAERMITRYRYVFTGVVHPERAAVNVSTTRWAVGGTANGISGDLTISITVSQLLVEIVQVIRPSSDQPIVFGVDIPVLRFGNADLSVGLTRMMRLFEDPRSLYLQRCLADFREAIRKSPLRLIRPPHWGHGFSLYLQ